jgi:hypothetical protein
VGAWHRKTNMGRLIDTHLAPTVTGRVRIGPDQVPIDTDRAPIDTGRTKIGTHQPPIDTDRAPIDTEVAATGTDQVHVLQTDTDPAPIGTDQLPIDTDQALTAPIDTDQAPIGTVAPATDTEVAVTGTALAPAEMTIAGDPPPTVMEAQGEINTEGDPRMWTTSSGHPIVTERRTKIATDLPGAIDTGRKKRTVMDHPGRAIGTAPVPKLVMWTKFWRARGLPGTPRGTGTAARAAMVAPA